MQHGVTQKMVPVKKILKYLGHLFSLTSLIECYRSRPGGQTVDH